VGSRSKGHRLDSQGVAHPGLAVIKDLLDVVQALFPSGRFKVLRLAGTRQLQIELLDLPTFKRSEHIELVVELRLFGAGIGLLPLLHFCFGGVDNRATHRLQSRQIDRLGTVRETVIQLELLQPAFGRLDTGDLTVAAGDGKTTPR